MSIKILIFGSGSIATRHYRILKKINKNYEIYLFTKRSIKNYSTLNSHLKILKFNPDYFIIASKTIDHFKNLKFIEKNFKNKKVLIEKPLFHKKINLNVKNKIFVGYDLRFHPVIDNIKKIILNKKIFSCEIICNSFLPSWRKNINYRKSYSSIKNQGGGVLLDLSHELDYANYFFGELIIKHAINKKISNLKISSDDYLNIYCENKFGTKISISINYFSKIPTRMILINGLNVSIKADLINNSLTFKSKTTKSYKYKINRNHTFIKQHRAIIDKKINNKISNYNNGLRIMSLIDNIKKIK